MDVNDLRTAVTVLSFVVFAGIACWAWSGRNRGRFDEASRLPFVEDGAAPRAVAGDDAPQRSNRR